MPSSNPPSSNPLQYVTLSLSKNAATNGKILSQITCLTERQKFQLAYHVWLVHAVMLPNRVRLLKQADNPALPEAQRQSIRQAATNELNLFLAGWRKN